MDNRAADAQLESQFAFRGQLFPNDQLPGKDHLFKPGDEILNQGAFFESGVFGNHNYMVVLPPTSVANRYYESQAF